MVLRIPSARVRSSYVICLASGVGVRVWESGIMFSESDTLSSDHRYVIGCVGRGWIPGMVSVVLRCMSVVLLYVYNTARIADSLHVQWPSK